MTQDNCISISYRTKEWPYTVTQTPSKTCFIIKAAYVNEEKAQKIAEILFPNWTDIKVESVHNDELTLTYHDYEELKMVINNKLIDSMKNTRTKWEDISHPLDLKWKKLLEKMNARIHQFHTPFCC